MVTAGDEGNLVRFLDEYGMAYDLQPPDGRRDLKVPDVPGATPFDEHRAHVFEVVQRFVRCFLHRDLPWHAAQEHGLMWAPLRKPHENLDDPHWQARRSYAFIEHPELGRSLPYPGGKWMSTATRWQARRRAPFLGEHSEQVLSEARSRVEAQPRRPIPGKPGLSARGKPFALQGIRPTPRSARAASWSAASTPFAALQRPFEHDRRPMTAWPGCRLPALRRAPVRGAPLYGEDNEYILGELLGYSTAAIRSFAEDDVI